MRTAGIATARARKLKPFQRGVQPVFAQAKPSDELCRLAPLPYLGRGFESRQLRGVDGSFTFPAQQGHDTAAREIVRQFCEF